MLELVNLQRTIVKAIAVGDCVPRPDFEAIVQARFENAVNLRLNGSDRLITLLVSDHYELPQGIRIPERPASLGQLQVGTRAWAKADVLRFESGALAIDMRGARTWRSPVRSLAVEMRDPASVEAWKIAWELLSQRQREAGAEVVAEAMLGSPASSTLGRKLANGTHELMIATGGLDAAAASQAARGLVGLGGGLTPAGDDLLVGFLAGLWAATGRLEARLDFLRRFGDQVRLLRSLTSDLGGTYLLHASEGRFSSSVSNLLATIARGGAVEAAAGEAFRVGHSSGMDCATGLLVGLAAWSPELLNRACAGRCGLIRRGDADL